MAAAHYNLSSKEDKLCYCIEKQDLPQIESLLAEGANATLVTSNGRSAIGFATSKGHTHILRILLESCEDPPSGSGLGGGAVGGVVGAVATSTGRGYRLPCDQPDNETETPDGMENLQWEEEIQENGQSENQQCSDDEWSRLYIYYAQMIEKTGNMLANTIKRKDPHCLDAFNYAPIHYAAMLGDLDSVKVLLSYNSPIDISTTSGFTPLHLAVEYTDVVRLLLDRKANPAKRLFQNLETPLHIAARVGNAEVVPMLLEAGADINAACALGRTSLLLALANKNTDVALVLLDHQAKLNIADDQGLTPLYAAIVMNNLCMAENLLRRGARLHMAHYLMHYCVRKNMLNMIRLLHHYGDNINLKEDVSGYTPLLLGISDMHLNVVRYLIEHGAIMNREDCALKELHVAVQESHHRDQLRPMAQLLLCSGVNIDTCNDWGGSPLHYAIMLEKYQMAEFLVKQGADVNAGCLEKYVDNLILTRQTKNVKLLKLLVYAGLKIHSEHRPTTIKPPPWHDENNMEDYLGMVCNNPLSLLQLSRIVIRNRLAGQIKTNAYAMPQNVSCYERWDYSILKYLIEKLSLPRTLEYYLYEFPDVPLLEKDIPSASMSYRRRHQQNHRNNIDN